jgi:hypothetical protein
MTTFPGSPKLLRGGIVLFDLTTETVQRIVVMQYNPATLNRTLKVQGAGGEGGDRVFRGGAIAGVLFGKGTIVENKEAIAITSE